MPPGDLLDRVHLGGLAVEMDRDDRPGSRCDRRLDLRRGRCCRCRARCRRRPAWHRSARSQPAVAKKVYGVVITSSPGPMSRAISGSKRRVGARRTADTACGAAVVGHLGLEPGDLRPEHEHLALEDLADDRLDLVADRLVLRLEIQGGNTDRFIRNAHRRSLL